jgi:hypothetical protein
VVPGGSGIDPFGTLPVGKHGNFGYLTSKRKLLAGYQLLFSTMNNNTNNQVVYIMFFPPERPFSPIKPTFGVDEVFHSLFSNPALLHVMLATLAALLSNLTNVKLGPDAVYHHSQAIATVNRSIAIFRHESTLAMDNTICVVATLAHLEVRILSIPEGFYL